MDRKNDHFVTRNLQSNGVDANINMDSAWPSGLDAEAAHEKEFMKLWSGLKRNRERVAPLQ